MHYCALADIEASDQDLIELTDDNGAGVVDQSVVDKAVAAAGDLIDGYLRGRYTLPLDPVPGLLATLAADITLYRLYARKPRLTVPESLADKHKNALKILDGIQKGTVTLGAGTPETDIPTGAVSLVKASIRIFDDDTLDKY